MMKFKLKHHRVCAKKIIQRIKQIFSIAAVNIYDHNMENFILNLTLVNVYLIHIPIEY